MIPSTHWYAWTPLPAMRSGRTGGHWGFGAYHLFAATTGRYRGPRRCPLSPLKVGRRSSSGLPPSSSSRTENNASLLGNYFFPCFGGVHHLQRLFQAHVEASHHCKASTRTPIGLMHWLSPPPIALSYHRSRSQPVASCRGLFLPASMKLV